MSVSGVSFTGGVFCDSFIWCCSFGLSFGLYDVDVVTLSVIGGMEGIREGIREGICTIEEGGDGEEGEEGKEGEDWGGRIMNGVVNDSSCGWDFLECDMSASEGSSSQKLKEKPDMSDSPKITKKSPKMDLSLTFELQLIPLTPSWPFW